MKIEKFVFAAFMLMASIPAFAQEENGFKKFNVREDFTENGFNGSTMPNCLRLATRRKAMP